ncbi:MAG: hypothetical protein HY719_03350, partial [Planctomycetes bacterium]|nr:hypothetical protein [Planctomycetota bacterium]
NNESAGNIKTARQHLERLEKDLEKRAITREEFEDGKATYESEIESEKVDLRSGKIAISRNQKLIARWKLMRSAFGAALAKWLVEDCPAQRVTAIDGVAAFSSTAPPQPYKLKDVEGKEAQEVTFPQGDGSGSEDKK